MLSPMAADALWMAVAATSLACVVVLTYAIDQDSPIRGSAYVCAALLMTISLFHAGRHAARLYSAFVASLKTTVAEGLA